MASPSPKSYTDVIILGFISTENRAKKRSSEPCHTIYFSIILNQSDAWILLLCAKIFSNLTFVKPLFGGCTWIHCAAIINVSVVLDYCSDFNTSSYFALQERKQRCCCLHHLNGFALIQIFHEVWVNRHVDVIESDKRTSLFRIDQRQLGKKGRNYTNSVCLNPWCSASFTINNNNTCIQMNQAECGICVRACVLQTEVEGGLFSLSIQLQSDAGIRLIHD